jgi:glycosyltransferase involved in cell wall biosynthesis
MTRPSRILYLEPSAQVTGGAIALLRLVSALDRRAFRPLVVLGSEGPLVNDFRRIPGCRVLCRPLPPGFAGATRFNMVTGSAAAAVGVLRYGAMLRRIADRWRPDVIHSNGLKMHALSLFARRRRARLVWHMRDFVAPPYMPRRSAALVRALTRRLPDVVVCNSNTTRAAVGRRQGALVVTSGIRIVPDGIECRHREPRSPSAGSPGRRVVLLGRIAEWKGQHVFVEAARRLSRTHASVEFVIAGGPTSPADAAYARQVRALVERYGLADRIRFPGVVRDVDGLLRDTDILAHCSVTPEPFGQVVIEAMAAAVPVVAARAGAPASIITDGVNGCLVPAGDDAALACALGALLDSDDRRSRLAAAGLATVRERYGIEQTVRAIVEVYRGRAWEGSHPPVGACDSRA